MLPPSPMITHRLAVRQRQFSRYGRLAWLVAFIVGLAPGLAARAAAQPAVPQATGAQTVAGKIVYLPLVFWRDRPSGSLADEWFLMVDDGHIRSRSVERQYYSFTKYRGNPIMVADRVYEGKAILLYGSVLPGFRMWYSAYNHNLGGTVSVLYAESKDGIRWNKPNLNGTASNIVPGGTNATLVSVLSTPHDWQRPLKFLWYQAQDFHGFWSQDGINLTPYSQNPFLTSGGDIAHFYYDPHTGQYAGTIKESTIVAGVKRRSARLLRADSFTNWSLLDVLLAPDEIDDALLAPLYPHFYGVPMFPAGEQYLGLLWLLKAPDQAGLYGNTEIQLVSSHDGIQWIREEGSRPPILDVGPAGAWDDGQIYTASQPIRVGDELWLYYSGCDHQHGSALDQIRCNIGLATLPYNRMASLSGSGEALTDERPGGNNTLHVNYDARGGTLCVELLSGGEPITGYSAADCTALTGNSLDAPVTWGSRFLLPDGPYQIRFILQNASLYAFALR